jgi:putative phage-type endonuclease
MANANLTRKSIEKKTGAVFLADLENGSQEWLDLRKTGIGGSEVATICGFNKWTSPYTLWCQKTGKASGEIDVNESMEWGNLLEPVIIDKFESNHPELKIHRRVGTWAHPDRAYQITNPDALFETESGELGVLEIKTAMYEDDWKDGVPRYYETQVQWYMQTFNIKKAWVAVLFHGNKYREYELDANEFSQEAALEQVEKFLELIKTNTEPDFDGSKSTLETLRTQHPEIETDLEVELGDLGVHYFNAQSKAEEATNEANALKARVMKEMGNARKGLIDGEWVLTRTSRSGGFPFLINSRKEA